MFLFSDLFISDFGIGASAWGGFYKIFGVSGKFETLNWFLTGEPRVDFKVRPKGWHYCNFFENTFRFFCTTTIYFSVEINFWRNKVLVQRMGC